MLDGLVLLQGLSKIFLTLAIGDTTYIRWNCCLSGKEFCLWLSFDNIKNPMMPEETLRSSWAKKG